MMKSGMFGIALCWLLTSGCGSGLVDDDQSRKLLNPVPADLTHRIELGVVSSDCVKSFSVRKPLAKRISKIRKSCGCATLDLKEGDLWDLERETSLALSIKNKHAGAQTQSIVIEFDDDTKLTLHISFTVKPPIQFFPPYILFKEGASITTIEVRNFIGAEAPNWTDLPAGFGVDAAVSSESRLTFSVSIDRSTVRVPVEGFLSIHLPSESEPRKIPYLILGLNHSVEGLSETGASLSSQ